jgi:hypothetical protein
MPGTATYKYLFKPAEATASLGKGLYADTNSIKEANRSKMKTPVFVFMAY